MNREHLSMEDKVDLIFDALVGGELRKDGGLIAEVDNLKEKVKQQQNFIQKLQIMFTLFATGCTFLGGVAGLLIAYWKMKH